MSTPSPFTVTKDGGHFEVKVDAHYVSDEEVEMVRRYVADLKAENDRLRELVRDMYACIGALCSMVENSPGCWMCPTNQDEERPCANADVFCRMAELGVKP